MTKEELNRMETILHMYYADNARRLHQIVDKIVLEFGGVANKDRDDFYSLANEVFVDVLKRYDGKRLFAPFLYSCLLNRIKSEFTRRNRERRKADRMTISLDMPVDACERLTWGDIIADTFDLEKAVFEKNGQDYSRKMVLYLSRLSKVQREILQRMAAGYLPSEIQEELHISKRQYRECREAIHSYRNVSVLF